MKNAEYITHISSGGVTSPKGFKASGISCGIKKDNSKDLALVYSKNKCSAAGVFTKNIVKGHSLQYCMENITDGTANLIFINSGNANACVGEKGFSDAIKIASKCSEILKIQDTDVLMASTGVIGYSLPVDRIVGKLSKACSLLSESGGNDAATAIMTTDTFTKEIAIQVNIDDSKVTIGGMAKGSGMIHPDMATMISIITTDVKIKPSILKKLLLDSADLSFNRISIDGDTSVCDTVISLANGQSGITINDNNYNEFKSAFNYICRELSKMIVRDGEGATKLLEINVTNAKDKESAKLASKAIANSPLVKTAFYGEDANWGRILTAAGYSGANFNPDKTSISIGNLILYNYGTAVSFSEDKARDVLKKDEIVITVDFNEGNFNDTVWTCDFSHKYIDINAHYRT